MSKGLVLISGINGYIAAVTAKHFLDAGLNVRGTARKLASAKEMIEGPLKGYAQAGRFEVVEVPDITVEGAFDEAVKGRVAYCFLIRGQETDFRRRHNNRSSRFPRFHVLYGPGSDSSRRHQRNADHLEVSPRFQLCLS
jgi:hypothetical protein